MTDTGAPSGMLGSSGSIARTLESCVGFSIFAIDLDGIVRLWSDGAARLYGYERAEIVGQPSSLLHVPEDLALSLPREMLDGALAAGSWVGPIRRVTKDGRRFTARVSVTTMIAPTGSPEGFLLVSSDMTDEERLASELELERSRERALYEASAEEEKRAARELTEAHSQAAESLALLESIQESAPVGLGFVDRAFRILHVNARLASIQGRTADQLLGLTLAEAIPIRWGKLEPMYRQILRTGEPVLNNATQGEDISHPGELRSWLSSYYPVTVDGGVIGVGQVTLDVTDTRRAESLRSAVEQNMAEGLYVMDGDGRVILINAAGSSILGWTQGELVGKPARTTIHVQDADGTPCDEAWGELMKLGLDGTGELAGECVLTGKDGRIIPVAYSASPLIDGSSPRGVVVVFRDITEERDTREQARHALDSLAWVGRTRDAIDEDRLVLYSQPILPLKGAKPRAELLLRMIGRHGEIISPGTFLPAAEQYGLIGDIDRWVIKQAIALAADGRSVQFNLSAQSVADRGLLASIERQLRETGTDPGNLVFEITETALMTDVTVGEQFAIAVTGLGCGVALDDFGMGFGSFTYLKRLAVTCLKIDIEFVRNLTTSLPDQHLVKAIVNLATGFGQQTVAEGVEDQETLELLRDYGVDFAQGFHVGRPAPITPPTTPKAPGPITPPAPITAPASIAAPVPLSPAATDPAPGKTSAVIAHG